MKQWVQMAVDAVTALIDGKPYTAPDDLTIGADRMHPEARALAPWATWGKYEAAPVPIAVLIEAGEFDASSSEKMTGFYKSMLASDGDKDIIHEWLAGGLEDESASDDTFLTFHHDTCADWREEFTELMDGDVERGYIKLYGAGVPCAPFRTPPKGMLDQVRKRRMITNHAYPKRSPKSNNGGVDLSDQPELRLSSGVKFGRNVAIMASSGVQVRIWKRDGLRAYRQARCLPLDWLRCGTIWRGGAAIDERVNFGGKASPVKFSRWYKVAIREAQRRIRAFDASHPTTDPLLLDWLAERKSILPIGQVVCGTIIQYIDDTLGASFDDAIDGSTLTRAQHHMRIFDACMSDADILMAEGSKAVDSTVGMEALGVWIDVVNMTASLTQERKAAIAKVAGDVLTRADNEGEIPRRAVESLVGKQKWLAHVAPQVNRMLASAYALVHAPGHSPQVTPSKRFLADQNAILELIPNLVDVPLVSRSAFAPFGHATHAIAFQDASECFGMGGWFVSDTTFYYYSEPWPDATAAVDLGAALRARPRRWWITHSELLAEAFAAEAVFEHMPHITHLTDFTDNEAARGAANRGSSSASPGMHVAAALLDDMSTAAGVTMRTVRVTTSENWIADQLSRGELGPAERAAIALGLTPCRVHFRADHPIWALAVVDSD